MLLCLYLVGYAVKILTPKIASASLVDPLSFTLCLYTGKFVAWISGMMARQALLFSLLLDMWLTYNVIWGLPTLPRRKLKASFLDYMPHNFMMAWTNDYSWLSRLLWPYPGSDTAAQFAPYLSTLMHFFPNNLPTIVAKMGHGWPRYVAIPIWNMMSPM